MYNLSPRFKQFVTSTSENLAPNHYHLEEFRLRKNVVPFLLGSQKVFDISNKKYTDALYDTNCSLLGKRVVGGGSIRNRSDRQSIVPKDAASLPGPADYNPTHLPRKDDPCDDKIKSRKLYVCRVPYSSEAAGPSIPTRIDENGYDFDIYHRLIKNPPDYHDQTLGPAFYKVSTERCMTEQLYKGSQFWRSRTKRQGFIITDGPAPNEYDARVHKIDNERDEYVREMARLYSYVPRFSEMQERKLRHEDLPGPADYFAEHSLLKQSLSLRPAAFGTKANRFVTSESEDPGPGEYDVQIPNTIQIPCCRRKTKSRIDISAKATPGPASYYIKGQMKDILEKQLRSLTHATPPFNCSSRRKMSFCEQNDDLPGPLEYAIQSKKVEKKAWDASVFKSRTERFPQTKKSGHAVDAASYNISEAFNKNRNRKCHHTGKVVPPFLSTQPRVAFQKTSAFYGPGPAKYSKRPSWNDTGYYFYTARIADEVEDIPGPGTYSVNRDVGLSKALTTHNLRLKENVLRTKLKQAPAETREAFKQRLKQRKQLRAYHKPERMHNIDLLLQLVI